MKDKDKDEFFRDILFDNKNEFNHIKENGKTNDSEIKVNKMNKKIVNTNKTKEVIQNKKAGAKNKKPKTIEKINIESQSEEENNGKIEYNKTINNSVLKNILDEHTQDYEHIKIQIK
jgi:hypothetical protein